MSTLCIFHDLYHVTYYVVAIFVLGTFTVVHPVVLTSLINLLFRTGESDYLGRKFCKIT